MSISGVLTESSRAREGRIAGGDELPAWNFFSLTQREQEIMKVLTLGFSSREIGSALAISPNTVRAHLNSIYQKLHVNSRARAVFKFQETIQQRAG